VTVKLNGGYGVGLVQPTGRTQQTGAALWPQGQMVTVVATQALLAQMPTVGQALPWAIAQWNEALHALDAPCQLLYQQTPQVQAMSLGYQGTVTVASHSANPQPWQRSSIAACCDTVTRPRQPNELHHAVVWLGQAPTQSVAWWQGVLLHEFGHALGLPHVAGQQGQAVMAAGQVHTRDSLTHLTQADRHLLASFYARA
jgi:hypothetical protein